MVKYQAFFVVKEKKVGSGKVVLAGNLLEIFSLNKLKSLSAGGGWGSLTLTNPEDYETWQQNWNDNSEWNSENAFIPFYLFPDYKSSINSFTDDDGNVLTEGRLSELFLNKFGIDIEFLTSKSTI